MKFKSLLCIMIFLLLLPMYTVYADVIFEPNDDFYESHRKSCVYVNRQFATNGEDGYVKVYTSPESGLLVGAIKNQSKANITYTYDKDGEEWGIIYYSSDESDELYIDGVRGKTGWILMNDMILVYDSRSFIEEHIDEINTDDINIDNNKFDIASNSEQKICVYEYPGGRYIDKLTVDSIINFDKTYYDDEGRLWGYCGYYYGWREIWVCVSEPFNEELLVKEIVYENVIWPVEIPDLSKEKSNDNTFILVGAFVIGVVCITVIFIHVLYKNKKRE